MIEVSLIELADLDLAALCYLQNAEAMLLIASPLPCVGIAVWIGHDTFSRLLVIIELALVSSSIDEAINTPSMLLLVVELAIVDFAVWIRELTAAVS